MLKNPYAIPTDENDQASCRFATYIDAADRSLLMSIRPTKGTAQAVVNHLILNLCNDLRELNITGFRPDADEIFSILVERRALNSNQLTRLRRTTIGPNAEVSTGIRHVRRGTSVREGSSDIKAVPDYTSSKVERGVGRTGEKTPGEAKSHQKSTKTSQDSRGHS